MNTLYFSFFRGNLKEPGQKECVLIIDRHTGEITLEKLSGHMLLKKTRQAQKQSAQIENIVNDAAAIAAAESALPLADYSNVNSALKNLPSASNSAIKSAAANHTSSRPQTPVSSFKRDSPGLCIL